MNHDDDAPQRLNVEWTTDDIPGAPLVVIVVTTRGAGPLFLPALTGLEPDDQLEVIAHTAELLERLAGAIAADVGLALAVDEAMGEPS